MVGTNIKGETMNLMDKRTAIEAEMNSIIDRLCQPGGPGLSGNLLDSEVHFLVRYLPNSLLNITYLYICVNIFMLICRMLNFVLCFRKNRIYECLGDLVEISKSLLNIIFLYVCVNIFVFVCLYVSGRAGFSSV